MKLIIDRFEGDIAVCEAEDGRHVDILRGNISHGAHEGDVISEADVGYIVERTETESRRRRIAGLLNGLIKR